MVTETTTDDVTPPNPKCPDCGANHAPGAKYCRACGADLARHDHATASSPAAPADRAAKSIARREFGRVKQIVTTLRAIYAVAAIVVGLAAVLPAILTGAILEPLGLGAALAFVTLLLGWRFVGRQPVLWSVVIAALWTIGVAMLVVLSLQAGDGIHAGLVVRAGLTLSFWAAVLQAVRLQRLMRDHSDFVLDRPRVADERRVEGGVAEQSREKHRRQKRETRRRRFAILGIAAALLTIGIVAAAYAMRPEAIDARIEAFESTWSGGDLDAVVASFDRAAIDVERVREPLARRGWQSSRPALGEARIIPHGDDGLRVAFTIEATPACAAGELELQFELAADSRQWRLIGLNVPAIRTADASTAAEAFRTAWNAPGLDALMTLCSDGLQRKRSSIERIFERRGWNRSRPAVDTTEIGAPSKSGTVAIDFGLAGGEGAVATGWEYWHPAWRMMRLKPPESR